MSEENRDAGELWNRIKASIATNVPPGSFDTWFRPLSPLRWDGSVLELTTPNETFRASFAQHFLDLLLQVATEVAGSGIEIRLSSREPEQSHGEGCAHHIKAQPLPVVRAYDLESPIDRPSWLIERLWTHQAVGVIGGSPKSGKTWLALEMAVSVASGSPCFDTFVVCSPGPVLLYAAEDSAAALRSRVETLARVHNVDFTQLDVHIITVDALRLDRAEHQDRLESTMHVYKPALLVIDPLVRVHAIDENVAGQVSMLLGYLRSLQRKTGAAIALIHHIRKNVSPRGTAGYSLRGSGDLYAWLDSFLYLRMHQGQRTLSAEHRSAPAWGPMTLELVESDSLGAFLKLGAINNSPPESPQNGLAFRIIELLSSAPEPLTIDALRSRLQVRNQRVVEAIRILTAQGKIQRLTRGLVVSPKGNLPVQMSL
jgi:hypothetical protein